MQRYWSTFGVVLLIVAAVAAVISSCANPATQNADSRVTLSFVGNGHDGGSPPMSLNGNPGELVRVPGSGTLYKHGCALTAWSANTDGSGPRLYPGDYALLPVASATFHAQWEPCSGLLDRIFPTTDIANENIRAIALQADGKILIGGDFTSVLGVARNRVARLNADGTLDTAFNSGAGANQTVFSIAVMNDGKILVGGYFSAFDGQVRHGLVRLMANGSVDGAVGDLGLPTIYAIAVRPDGTVVVGGSNVLAAFDQTAFTNATPLWSSPIGNGGQNGQGNVYAIAPLSDNKVLVGGSFTHYGATVVTNFLRVSAGGAHDANMMEPNATVYTIRPQTDGPVFIGGAFDTVSGHARSRLAGYLFSSVATVNPGYGANGPVHAILEESATTLIAVGHFNRYDGVTVHNVVRLHSAGYYIAHFESLPTGLATTAAVRQPNGKILVVAGRAILRLNP